MRASGMRLRLLAPTVMVALASPSAFAQPKVDPEVQKHFELGNQLYAEGRYEDALVEYDKAYALSKNWKILYNRGQVLVMLRRDPEAIEAFEAYLAQGGADVPEERRKEVETDLAKLRQRLAKVTLEGAPDKLEILVDGRAVGTTPRTEPLVVGAGKHEIALRRGPTRLFVKDIQIAAGESQTIRVEIAPDPKPELPKLEERGLVSPAFTFALSLGLAAPLANVARGNIPLLGAVDLYAGWRFHPLWSLGVFVGGAAGRVELRSSVATTTTDQVDPKATYSYGMGGVRARLHILRDKYFDGWLGLDFGAWRETWKFNPPEGNTTLQGYEWAATSPAFGLAAGLDFPLAKTWAIGGLARVFGTAVRTGDRFGCPANDTRCDRRDLPGGGGEGPRGFLEVSVRLTYSLPYGGS